MRAFFFDLDGTLFDTRADLAATVNHTRRDLGLAELPVPDVIACVGRGAAYLLEHAIPERKGDDVRHIFFSHYEEHCCESLVPYPGVLETLAELKRRGFALGVNTNKPNFAVRAILKKFDLETFFGAAVVAGYDGFPLKPDPGSIRACAEKLGHALGPDDWMVGDSWTDMRCAEAAGVRGAYCTYGFSPLDGASCVARIGAFSELLELGGQP